MPDSVGSHPQYDVFADEFLDHARDGLYNAHYDRPACLGLLGDVAGRTVLDAACGPGLYAEELTVRGATVIGFDQSPRMAELSRQRVPSGDFRAHDLADPLHGLADGSVDLVLLRRCSRRVKNCTTQASSSSDCSSRDRPRTRPKSIANATTG